MATTGSGEDAAASERPQEPQLTVTVLTAFPNLLAAPFSEGIVERARRAGLVEARAVDLRQFAHDRHRTLDDTPYGGGAGMLLMAPPILEALAAVGAERRREGTLRVLLAPDGMRFHQHLASTWARTVRHLVLVCGRYEGIDERVRAYVDVEVSLGDFVLMGGEAAAWAIAEAVIRLVPGVVEERSLAEESFHAGLLEGPQFTRPLRVPSPDGGDATWEVPEVLRSGDHGRVWRAQRRASLARTLVRRPDLFMNASLLPEDAALLGEVLAYVGGTVRGGDTAEVTAGSGAVGVSLRDDWAARMLY